MIKLSSRCLLGALAILACSALGIGKANAAFRIIPTFTLHSFNSGLCLAVSNNNPNRGGQIITWPCNGTPSQDWFVGDATANGNLDSGGFSPDALQLNLQANTLNSLVNGCSPFQSSCLVLGVRANVMQNGTPIVTWSEDPTNFGGAVNNQGWGWEYAGMSDQTGHACYWLLNAGTQTGEPFMLTGENPVVISQNFPSSQNQTWCVWYN